MKKIALFVLGLCFLALSALTSARAQGGPVCRWQLTGEREALAGANREGVSVSRQGNSLQTSYRHGGNMGCNDPTFSTTHTWSQPPNILTPGESLSFDVTAAWSLDGSPGCSSLTAGVNTAIMAGTTRILAEQKKIIVSKEPEGSVSNAGVWVVPAGRNAGETLTLTAHADGGGVGGSVFYEYRWVCATPEPSETPASRAESTLAPSPTACPPLDAKAKLRLVLERYYAQIPSGLTNSGNKNNILSLFDDAYDEYVCGSYQAKVLQLLGEIKFDPDPCVRAWLDDWDYGPIEALWGGHQAVVIYPVGTTWTETGLVLDPWISQSPKTYSIQAWALNFSAGSELGLRGSRDYEKQAQYPTVGGAYAPPGELKLSGPENEFIRSLPQEKQDWLKKMSPVTRKAWVTQALRKARQNVTVSVNSPLDAYLTDDAGHYSGVREGVLVNDLPEVTFRRFLRTDGEYWTEMEYPSDQPYRLVLYGTADGMARLFSAIDETVYQYDFFVRKGRFHDAQGTQVGVVIFGAHLRIEPKQVTTVETDWFESQPTLAEPKEANWDATPVDIPPWLLLALATGGLCCLGGLGAGSLGLVFFLRGRKPQRTAQRR